MKRIGTRSNWGYFEELDGRDLEAGEALRVEWPDGTTTEGYVMLARDNGVYPSTRAEMIVEYRGLRIAAPLRGLPAERIEQVDPDKEE